ncbi:uncharacterized protein [Temnothorax nylanderi]|uniref:uncharacterized protein n=1 Tax=Temnothorax nylanderi TaxID=102681 RepID=UPI003A8C05D8
MSNEYKYRLVEFEKTKNKVKSVDIVPNEWIIWDEEKDDLMCYFMPPPYSKEKLIKLRNLIKTCQRPDYSWPKYVVQSRGKARTYTEAEEKLKKLNVQQYAFTTDSELDAATKSKHDLEELKMRETQNKKGLSTQEIFNSAQINLKKKIHDESFQKKNKKSSIDGKLPVSSSSSDDLEIPCSIPQKSNKNQYSAKKSPPPSKKHKLKEKNYEHEETFAETDVQRHSETCSTSQKSNKKYHYSTKRSLSPSKKHTESNYEYEELSETFAERTEEQLKELKNELTLVQKSILKLTVDVENILSILQNQVKVQSRISSEDEENDDDLIKLPCDSIEQFEKFNEKLKSNKKYQKKIVSIYTYICIHICIY